MHREVKLVARGHTPGQWQCLGQSSCSSALLMMACRSLVLNPENTPGVGLAREPQESPVPPQLPSQEWASISWARAGVPCGETGRGWVRRAGTYGRAGSAHAANSGLDFHLKNLLVITKLGQSTKRGHFRMTARTHRL